MVFHSRFRPEGDSREDRYFYRRLRDCLLVPLPTDESIRDEVLMEGVAANRRMEAKVEEDYVPARRRDAPKRGHPEPERSASTSLESPSGGDDGSWLTTTALQFAHSVCHCQWQ